MPAGIGKVVFTHAGCTKKKPGWEPGLTCELKSPQYVIEI
jgi:hypothetical protein